MIEVLDIYETLEHGELFQSYLTKDRTLKPKFYEGINKLINDAVIDLHTKLELVVYTAKIRLLPGFDGVYKLDKKYIWSQNNSNSYKYIIDSPIPFVGRVIKIKKVSYENTQTNKTIQLPVNIIGIDEPYINTPSYNSLQFISNEDNKKGFLHITYIGYPELIPNKDKLYDGRPIYEYELDIPIWLKEPIILYLGAKVLSRNSNKNAAQESQLMLDRYKTILAEYNRTNLLNRESYFNTNLDKQGWV